MWGRATMWQAGMSMLGPTLLEPVFLAAEPAACQSQPPITNRVPHAACTPVINFQVLLPSGHPMRETPQRP